MRIQALRFERRLGSANGIGCEAECCLNQFLSFFTVSISLLCAGIFFEDGGAIINKFTHEAHAHSHPFALFLSFRQQRRKQRLFGSIADWCWHRVHLLRRQHLSPECGNLVILFPISYTL